MALPPQLEGKTLRDNPQNINRKGRVRGSRNRATIVREAIEAIRMGHNQTYVDAMTAAIIEKAMNGDVPAFKELLDSAYGKVTDKVETSGPDGGPIENKLTVEFIGREGN